MTNRYDRNRPSARREAPRAGANPYAQRTQQASQRPARSERPQEGREARPRYEQDRAYGDASRPRPSAGQRSRQAAQRGKAAQAGTDARSPRRNAKGTAPAGGLRQKVSQATDALSQSIAVLAGRDLEEPRTEAEAPKEKKKARYIPALDGLRAFAVLAVIAYHMSLPWAPSGLLGVTIFFVISGYLITSLLLIEWDNTKRINLPQFWLRRVRRLFPAIAFVIICSAALFTFLDHSLLTKLREDIWAALLWFTNWWYILRDVSYFEALGAPSPLTHFWSLAIEEQFYLVWPLVIFACHKLGLSRNAMGKGALVLACASALEMALLYSPDADPSRVYYGTDTRAFSLLIGAYLSFRWPLAKMGPAQDPRITQKMRKGMDLVGIAALAGLALMIIFVGENAPFLYRGGLVIASVLAALVIAVLVHPASSFAKIMAAKPLVWIGLRSYGIYLWHFPLLLLMNPVSKVTETPWYLYPVMFAVICACAAFSYTFVENPIRHGALGNFVKRLRSGEISPKPWLRQHIIPTAAATALTCVCIGGLIFVPDTSAVEGADLLLEEGPQVAGLESVKEAAQEEESKLDVLLIGDSVSVRAIPYFQEAFPHGAIDAEINRWFGTGIDVFRGYKDQNVVGDVVVFALGTNGPVSDEEFDQLMELVGKDREVFFVNTRSPQYWVADSNDALARGAERHKNAHVIDWFNISNGRGELFDGDGTHLSEEGARFYIQMINDEIGHLLPKRVEAEEAPSTDGEAQNGPSAEGGADAEAEQEGQTAA